MFSFKVPCYPRFPRSAPAFPLLVYQQQVAKRVPPPLYATPGMASHRRRSNGSSPLVASQRQITSFFSTGKSKPSPQENPSISNPDPSPPYKQNASKKPQLLIGRTPTLEGTAKRKDSIISSAEMIGKRVRVFWPLDKSWYEGRVESFDGLTGKHLVRYDDDEEETLDLSSEIVEFLDEKTPRSFRRLRRKFCMEEEEEEGCGEEDGGSDDDSTRDKDWGKSAGKDAEEEDDSSEEVELEDEKGESPKGDTKKTAETRKRGMTASLGKADSAKRFRVDGDAGKKAPPGEAFLKGNAEEVSGNEKNYAQQGSDNLLSAEAAERFGRREAEKFRFLLVERKDAKGRRPGDENYDPKTLYLPPDFLKRLSGGQRQWWEFKSKHMDKILFFKMGKFYELFEMDAHVGAKELDLQYMKGDQPHCGFPEKNFSTNLEKLANKGYRVLVIEQIETPEQLEIRRKEMGSKDKVVKREICAVVTKGTLIEGELLSTNPESSYLISLTERCSDNENAVTIGACVVDVSTSKFMLGQFEDDSERKCLCSILSELRPVEIIKPSKVLSLETERALLKHTRSPLVNELVPSLEFWDAGKTIFEIGDIYECKPVPSSLAHDLCTDSSKKDEKKMPDVLCDLVGAGDNGCYALSAFGGCLFYLRRAFLCETLLKCAKFEPLPSSNALNNLQKTHMILDAATLENLEILENKNGGLSGTLFAHLDHCVTAFGKRLLRSWLVRPLYDVSSIVERQDAIAELKGSSHASALKFRTELSRLPDMERILARLFASCEASGRNSSRIILYEDAAKKLLTVFLTALHGCQLMDSACSSLGSILSTSTSNHLHHLLTPGKGLPHVSPIIKHFFDAFDWAEADQSGRIVPHEGTDVEYDYACQTVDEIEIQLKSYLKEQRAVLEDSSINYINVGKDLYLLEVPEYLRNKIPQDYELQSSKKGYFRYWTPKIKKLLIELSHAESEKESKLKSILHRLIEHFCEHHILWRQLVSVTAEIDVLISIAGACDFNEGPSCRPRIKASPCLDETTPVLSCQSLGHPLLCNDALGTGFVPNNVSIGGPGGPRFILLTGPNMGGKSTLLRQVCLTVILAQIGANVPAEDFELSPVDRIFVRMGAKDNIMSGQSTFLTELSETSSMLSSATPNSLVALDELGRGTSTSDGQAIAESVLEYFTHTVQCRGIFSTHYHRLSVNFKKDLKVSLCHMACRVGEEAGGVEEVTFLYKLMPGPCPKSYGVNVARLAGLPSSVLLKAMKKSGEFDASYGKHKEKSETKFEDHTVFNAFVVIKEFLECTTKGDCGNQSHPSSLRQLIQLQSRARSLVQKI